MNYVSDLFYGDCRYYYLFCNNPCQYFFKEKGYTVSHCGTTRKKTGVET